MMKLINNAMEVLADADYPLFSDSGDSNSLGYNPTDDIYNVICSLAIFKHITCEIIGTWAWIHGTNRDDIKARTILKDGNFKWHSKKMKWFKPPTDQKSRFFGQSSIEDIRAKYGSEIFKTRNNSALTSF